MLRSFLGSLWRPVKGLGHPLQGRLARPWEATEVSVSQGYSSSGIPSPSSSRLLQVARRTVLHQLFLRAGVTQKAAPQLPLLPYSHLLDALRSVFPGIARKMATQNITSTAWALPKNTSAFRGRFYTGRGPIGQAPPFGRIFPAQNTMFGAYSTRGFTQGSRQFGGRRNFTTGFGQQTFQSHGPSVSNSFAGFKVLPGAVTEEMKDKNGMGDDLKARLRARVTRTPKRRLVPKAVKSIRPARLGVLLKRAVDVEPAGLGAAVENTGTAVVVRTAKKVVTKRSPVQVNPASSKAVSVSMSIFLYGPPAWEMDSISRAGSQNLTVALITEIRSLARLHKDHLTATAIILEKLLQSGLRDLHVREEEGGTYELIVAFPTGLSLTDVVDYLLVMGIDPCSPHFKLEEHQLKSDMPRRQEPAMNGVNFPWPAAHSCTSSLDSHHVSDNLPADASAFLSMVESLISASEQFGSGSRGTVK
ncbi:uncharacterized protein SPPG_07708 [Spizellomyces punctatus DAOM BR117]|uniref:Uncharacterized protein n=1 Tax=Spizellomyces punctatus (strain DAOM BR117) TaxID=645134 RepID=A0A0L0H852_SPIPD|nr:uncharacterized protein SPPG_07708 [Spizellomyces punctatus DAOM BR117]KNC96878.1 hypothetical protein SPPG_07708 [Spizellomyces punctatus DAOM BR117]|eukprot:XP_016604918.1 hypothetical protein SPPG_07708 [Spizellomyces punctatus DAOM BR117]